MSRPARWIVPVLGLAIAGNAGAQGPPIGFRLGADRTELRPGGTTVLTVTARIPRGWHLYGLRQPAGGPLATVLQVGPQRVFTLASAVTSSRAKAELDPNFGMVVEWHDDSATFRLPVQASRDALPGTYDALVRVSYQRCNDRICLPLKTDTLKAPLTVAGAPEPVRPRPAGGGRGPSTSAPVRRPIALAGLAVLQDPWLEDTSTGTTMLLLGDSADVEGASRSGGLLRYLLPAAVILMLVLAASTRRRPQEPPHNPFGLKR